MSIKRYNEKRNFTDTPEPSGKVFTTPKSGGLKFVVQKHRASHLHYDFRLELNGVLLSWAVPKGPSLNPDDKRLAMHVEDHPMDYRTFEGIIPEGNYGAGTVMVWDEGTYAADPELSKAENIKQLNAGYKKGHLRFVMHGKKLQGAFSLIKMRGNNKYGSDEKAWLLVKSDDEAADREQPVADQDRSAVTGRSLEEIARDAGAVWESPKKKTGSAKTRLAGRIVEKASVAEKGIAKPAAPKGRKAARGLAKEALALGGKLSKVPDVRSPQLATLVDAPFDRDGWVFEIKWDGYRALGYHPKHDRVALVSRNGLSFDAKFGDIVAALDTLPCAAIVDGEVCALDSKGRSSFAKLQQHEDAPAELVYCLFDLLYVDGVDVRELPLLKRKALLKKLLQDCDPRLQYSDHIETAGRDFFALAQRNGLEGIIAKDAQASYHSTRTRHWLKIKVEQRQEFIIAGYTAPRRSRSDIGSLILAYYERKDGKSTGRLRFAGHVGSGMDTEMRAELKKKLGKLARKTSPFDVRTPTNEQATWAKPELVCEVRFTEKTSDCQLRHPVFIALRNDKPASAIFWDVAEPAQAAVKTALKEDRQERAKRAAPKAKAKRASSRKAAAETPRTPTKTARTRSGARPPQLAKGGLGRDARVRDSARNGVAQYFGREAPVRRGMVLKVGEWEVPVSQPQRVYYPDLNITKLDVINYYRGVAPLLLHYLRDRPIVVHHVSRAALHTTDYMADLPDWVARSTAQPETALDETLFVLCQNEATLVHLVNLGSLELHPWNSRVQSPDCADWMLFDLDPAEAPFEHVAETALGFHRVLAEAGVPHYCKTSGKRGLHVVVPLAAQYDSASVRTAAAATAERVHRLLPALTSLERSPSKRRHRVYIDYTRNSFGKTICAPYSLRPVEYAGVAAPLGWDELEAGIDPHDFTLDTMPERIARVGDLWSGLLDTGADLRALTTRAQPSQRR